MPIVRTCSAAISAACQRLDGDDDVAEKMISWGVIAHQNGVGRIGFSSGDTGPLREGDVYSN